MAVITVFLVDCVEFYSLGLAHLLLIELNFATAFYHPVPQGEELGCVPVQVWHLHIALVGKISVFGERTYIEHYLRHFGRAWQEAHRLRPGVVTRCGFRQEGAEEGRHVAGVG